VAASRFPAGQYYESQRPDCQVRYQSKVTYVVRRNCVACLKCSHADQQTGEGNTYARSLTFSIDSPGAQRNGNCHRISRNRAHQFIQKPLTLLQGFCRIGARYSVSEFEQCYDRYSDLIVFCFANHRFKQLPRIQSRTFGGYDYGRIENQTQAGGSSGSR
jgi:hypothetical protein